MHNLTDEHEDLDLIQAVAKQLHIKTSKELHDLREVLFPSILCAMVHAGAGIFFAFFSIQCLTKAMGLSCNSSSVGMDFLHSFMPELPQPLY